ncbi:MAG: formate dehydrogenase family accessory protein FdhD [Candidatus Altiarchaeales archaeon HGW-Altiarchaeales-3]|nr:MAG: formate dehydrogenase family accessory protein FdhD [Candidatus Altiarchaeales archaeon HGW-Altiarchaeales-3]
MDIARFSAVRVENNKVSRAFEEVVREEKFSLYLNEKFIVNLIASNNQIKELGAGYVVCEGLAEEISDVKIIDDKIFVYAKKIGKFKPELRSSGCIGTQNSELKKVNSDIKINPGDVSNFAASLESKLWAKTGGVHCSVLFLNKKLIAMATDIGRHNTIDKVVGYAILNKINLRTCVIACTGRQPGGMIFKISNAQIPIIISRAAPTDKGILAAKDAGITLICFARKNKFNIYTHEERVNLRDMSKKD